MYSRFRTSEHDCEIDSDEITAFKIKNPYQESKSFGH